MGATIDDDELRDGRIVTFYSYKGGTGRTMAAVNVAYLLARGHAASEPCSVLVIDWDLEAPGVPKYLPAVRRDHRGLIDFFFALRARLDDGASGAQLYAAMAAADSGVSEDLSTRRELLVHALDAAVPLLDYVQYDVGDPSSGGRLAVLSSGEDGDDYATRVTTFDWPGFFAKYPAVFAALRERLSSAFDYVIVDSRTGVTDASGICSVLLPERLVCVFTPNRQSLEGGISMVKRALTHRRSSSLDPRPLVVYPLPSRVEMSETKLREEWRVEYQSAFEETFEHCYDQEDCSLTHYFDEMKVHHRSDYAYGEKIAVLSERDEEASLARVFRKFASWLASGEVPWGDSPVEASPTPAPSGPGPVVPRAGERPLADAVRKWQANETLVPGSRLEGALAWAIKAGFLYSAELELVGRSLSAELHKAKLIQRYAVLGVLVVAMSVATGAAFWFQTRVVTLDHTRRIAELTLELQQAEKARHGETALSTAKVQQAQARSAQVTGWLDVVARSALLLDDMKDLSFDYGPRLPLPSQELFHSASDRLDDLTNEISKLSEEVEALIAALSGDGAKALPDGELDPLPALQYAMDHLQQASEQLTPLREKRDTLSAMLQKTAEQGVVNLKRDIARGLWQQGYKLQLQGEYVQAQQKFDAALVVDDTYEGAYNSLGRLAMMRGDLLEARDFLEKALLNDPRHPVALANLAELYVMLALPSNGATRTSYLAKARGYIDKSIMLDSSNHAAIRTRERIKVLESEPSLGPTATKRNMHQRAAP